MYEWAIQARLGYVRSICNYAKHPRQKIHEKATPVRHMHIQSVQVSLSGVLGKPDVLLQGWWEREYRSTNTHIAVSTTTIAWALHQYRHSTSHNLRKVLPWRVLSTPRLDAFSGGCSERVSWTAGDACMRQSCTNTVTFTAINSSEDLSALCFILCNGSADLPTTYL